MAEPISTPGVSSRAAALQKLKEQMPAANQRVAQQFQAGQAMQLQQAVKAAPQAAATPAVAQQLGTQATSQAGQFAVKQAEQQQQQQQQLGGLALEAQKAATQKTLTGLEEGNKAELMSSREKLNKLSEDAAKELFDKQMQFAKDEQGRAFMNERQIADYMRLKAGNDEQFKAYAQKAQQIQKNTMRIQEAAYRKLEEALQNEQKLRQLGYDEEMIKDLRKLKDQMQSDLQSKQAMAEQKAGFWTAVGTMAGGAFGGVGGAQLGAGVGSLIGRS